MVRTRAWVLRSSLCGITLAWISLYVVASAQEQAAREYVSHKTCRLCHNKAAYGTQWDIWERSPHARAYATLKNEESARIAKARNLEGNAWESAQCLRCHVTAYSAQSPLPERIRAKDGVQCESCHGQGSLHPADGRRVWLGKDPSVDLSQNIRRPTGQTCLRCHRSQSPTWDPERYALPDGATTGFDFEQAFEKMAHPLLRHFEDDYETKKEPRTRRRRGRATGR